MAVGKHSGEEEPLHGVYLPFSRSKIVSHFAKIKGTSRDSERHLAYYEKSLSKWKAFETKHRRGPKQPAKDAMAARQLEKDERFWTLASLLGTFDEERGRVDRFAKLLARAIEGPPPMDEFDRWEDALAGRLRLLFEVSLPSPPGYREWLKGHVEDRALIPHLREAAQKSRLEGSTHVDAVLLSEDTGFAVFFEAKVLSDADSKIRYDVLRNQLARNIDVMLESHADHNRLDEALRTRKPDLTCFVLLTPRIFQEHKESRLYGWLLPEYQSKPALLKEHLAHRDDVEDWGAVSRRLGWLTFEDCEEVTPGSCSWLSS